MTVLKKAPLAGITIAIALAVLPTAIVAHLATASDDAAKPATTSPADISADLSEPATRPSRPGALSTAGVVANDARNRLGALGRRTDATQEEIQAAVDFFTANSPNRMAYFARLRLNSPIRNRQSLVLVQLYRPILNFKDSNPQLFDLLVSQVKLRDEAFELAKNGKTAALREKAAEIVAKSIQARTLRLNILRNALDEQQAKLDNDQANQDAAAEREATEITSEEQRLSNAVDRLKKRERNQSMLDVDPGTDPLAEVAPITDNSVNSGS